MFFKVIKDGTVLDVVNHLTFMKYQKKHDIMVSCDELEAEAILSSDGNYIWNVNGFAESGNKALDTVELVEIDRYEYDKLKALNLKTPEEIIDAYTISLIGEGVL